MAADAVPSEIRALADARSDARRARDWATADRLKAEIEAAGWKVIDAASLYTLERAAPADREEDGRVRYGSSTSVPSRLDDAPVGVVTVVLVATDDVGDVVRQVGELADEAPDGTQIVVVANAAPGPATEALAMLDARDPGAPGVVTEVVWTAATFGAAAAWNAGIRRATAPIVVLVGAGGRPTGEALSAIVGALDDEAVAVAGPRGLVSADLRSFVDAPPDATSVDAIAAGLIGFRRVDAVARGLLDEHFVAPDHLDTWWSFVLRDPPWDEDDEGVPSRRAVQVRADATGRPVDRPARAVDDPERARQAKRNFYRFLKRFATRRDLLTREAHVDR